MKKVIYLFMGILACSLFSCSENLDDLYSSSLDLKVQTRSLGIDSINKGKIIPLPESPNKRKHQAKSAVNENHTFFGIRELDVHIIVRENTQNTELRYLTSEGVGREVVVSAKKNSSNQKFKLYIMPMTGYIYIKDYQGNLLSLGVYSSAPDTRVLYVKSGTSSQGSCWDFLRGKQREFSNILENADAIEQGPNGMWDVYNEVIGVVNSKIQFDKYRNDARQEFEIRLVEPLKIIGSPTYNLDGITPEQRPNIILRGTVYNGNNTSTTMTIQYSEGASVTSSFQENKSFTTTVNANTGVKTPIFSIGGGVSSSSTYGFTYGSSSSKDISYTYNVSVLVDPLKTVRVSCFVKNYNVNCNYRATVEGEYSGRRFDIEGVWEGISCADVDYIIEPLNAQGIPTKTIKIKGNLNTILDLTEKTLSKY